jgi:hypothetical protein
MRKGEVQREMESDLLKQTTKKLKKNFYTLNNLGINEILC